MAALGMVAVFHDFGFERIASRRIARRPEERDALIGRLAAVRLALAPVLALVAVAALAASGERGALLVWAAGAITAALALRALESVDVVLQVEQRMGRSVVASRAGGLAQLATNVALAALGVTAPGPYLVALALGSAVSATLRLRAVRPYLALRLRWDPTAVRAFFREAWPVGIMAALMALYLHVDMLLVRAIAGPHETGRYGAAYRLFLFAASVPGLVMVSMAPVLSARWVSDRAAFRGGALRTVRTMTTIAIPAAGVGMLVASPVLALLFGERYAGAAPALRWLAVAAAATWPATVAIGALIAADRERAGIRLAAVALGLNVGLDLALIPAFGATGAAVATAATETVVAVAAIALLVAATRERRA